MILKKDVDIILASSSPRRQELLKLITHSFRIISSDIDETLPDDIYVENCAEYLAEKKAMEVYKKEKNSLIIGCDTVVVINNEILGKPKDKNDAYEMLNKLSGKTHLVITGCCIIYKNDKRLFKQITKVEMVNLTVSEIEEYILSKEPFGKAGGYAIQGKGALFIKGINGDFYNVMGLPVSRLNRELKDIIGK